MNNNVDLRWFFEDGVEVTSTTLDGITLNGRQSNDETQVPMEVFHFDENSDKLHLVCASADYGIEFTLKDGAAFHLIELDGYQIDPVTTNAVYLQPGETAVVKPLLKAGDPQVASVLYILFS